MRFLKRRGVFDPLDLEIMDRVYETAWAQLEAREPLRDEKKMPTGSAHYASSYSPSPRPV